MASDEQMLLVREMQLEIRRLKAINADLLAVCEAQALILEEASNLFAGDWSEAWATVQAEACAALARARSQE